MDNNVKNIRIEVRPEVYNFLKSEQAKRRSIDGRKTPLADILCDYALKGMGNEEIVKEENHFCQDSNTPSVTPFINKAKSLIENVPPPTENEKEEFPEFYKGMEYLNNWVEEEKNSSLTSVVKSFNPKKVISNEILEDIKKNEVSNVGNQIVEKEEIHTTKEVPEESEKEFEAIAKPLPLTEIESGITVLDSYIPSKILLKPQKESGDYHPELHDKEFQERVQNLKLGEFISDINCTEKDIQQLIISSENFRKYAELRINLMEEIKAHERNMNTHRAIIEEERLQSTLKGRIIYLMNWGNDNWFSFAEKLSIDEDFVFKEIMNEKDIVNEELIEAVVKKFGPQWGADWIRFGAAISQR